MRTSAVYVVLGLGVVSLVSGFSFQGDKPAGPDPKPIFQAKCARCHSGANPAGALDLSGELPAIAGTVDVVRGRPHASRLFLRVNDGTMPKGGQKLSDDEIATIRDWIVSRRPDPRPTFQAKCAGCHNAAHPAAGMDLSGDLKALAALKQTGTGDGTGGDSVLVQRLKDGSMPKGGTKLDDKEIQNIQDWVARINRNPTVLFKAKCIRCHSGGSPAGGLDLTGDVPTLARVPAVVAGNPAASSIYKQMADGSMPKGGKPVDDSALGATWDWIGSLQSTH